MSRAFQERDVRIIEFSEDYDSLDYPTLEAIGELIRTEALDAVTNGLVGD